MKSIVTSSLRFYSVPFQSSKPNGWGAEDNDLKICDIFEQMGRPQMFKLAYTWHDKQTLLTFAIQSAMKNVPNAPKPLFVKANNSMQEKMIISNEQREQTIENTGLPTQLAVEVPQKQQNQIGPLLNSLPKSQNAVPTSQSKHSYPIGPSNFQVIPLLPVRRNKNTVAENVVPLPRQTSSESTGLSHVSQISASKTNSIDIPTSASNAVASASTISNNFRNILKRRRGEVANGLIKFADNPVEEKSLSPQSKKHRKRPEENLSPKQAKKPVKVSVKASSKKKKDSKPSGSVSESEKTAALLKNALPMDSVEQDQFANYLASRFEDGKTGDGHAGSLTASAAPTPSIFADLLGSPFGAHTRRMMNLISPEMNSNLSVNLPQTQFNHAFRDLFNNLSRQGTETPNRVSFQQPLPFPSAKSATNSVAFSPPFLLTHDSMFDSPLNILSPTK